MSRPDSLKQLYQLFVQSSGVTTDTRNVLAGNIFFALKGQNFNANLFAEEALNKGASYVVVDEICEPDWIRKYGERLIVVENVLQILQQLSGYHRSQLKCPVLAITGSNGKTTTKELIAAVLSKQFGTYATKGNLNNHIGIPLTLLSIKEDVEFAVIEMGANHQKEIASYCNYVMPDFGLITNVGLAHIEGFGGFEGVVKGKTELFAHLSEHGGRVFVSSENDILLNKLKEYGFNTNNTNEVITYGISPESYCSGSNTLSKDFLSVIVEGVTIQTNLVGDYNFDNVMSAVCVGKYFGVGIEKIKEAIESYIPTNNRSQRISLGTNAVILDAYNANPSSMAEALKNFSKLEAFQKVVILGEMMELGQYSLSEHEKIFSSVKEMQLTHRIFVGKGFEFLRNSEDCRWFEKTELAKEWFRKQHFENTLILIKGSRKNELEKILKD